MYSDCTHILIPHKFCFPLFPRNGGGGGGRGCVKTQKIYDWHSQGTF